MGWIWTVCLAVVVYTTKIIDYDECLTILWKSSKVKNKYFLKKWTHKLFNNFWCILEIIFDVWPDLIKAIKNTRSKFVRSLLYVKMENGVFGQIQKN